MLSDPKNQLRRKSEYWGGMKNFSEDKTSKALYEEMPQKSTSPTIEKY